MFNLTAKKYLFFLISGLIIVPGLISLLFVGHLNLGIDFTGGSTVDLRFQNTVSRTQADQIAAYFSSQAHTRDTNVYLSQQTNTTGVEVFWLEFDQPVDSTFQKTILSRLNGQPSIAVATAMNPLIGVQYQGKTVSFLPFSIAPTQSTSGGPAIQFTAADIQKEVTAAALPTTGPVQQTGAAATPTAATTGTATKTATATATVAATKTATATATAAAAASTTATASSSGTKVQLLNVFKGSTNQVVTVQTQTFLSTSQLTDLEAHLLDTYGPIFQSQVSTVGPSIASQTTLYAILAVVAASIAILVYIGIAFSNVGSLNMSFKYGVCAIIALLHDVLVVLGVWSILGFLFPQDFVVDTLFVTAVLTVIGFSVHDTIVVFDRIRENSRKSRTESFDQIVNASLLQTMARSLNTSFTVVVTLSSLVLFAGGSIRSFTLALLIGIVSGTYSSIFNASMFLVMWENREWRNWGKAKSQALTQSSRGVGVVGNK